MTLVPTLVALLRPLREALSQVYGEEVAILAGDALLTYAFEHIAEKTPTEGDGCADPRTVLKVLSYIGRKVGPACARVATLVATFVSPVDVC
jgi:hypothetical protein